MPRLYQTSELKFGLRQGVFFCPLAGGRVKFYRCQRFFWTLGGFKTFYFSSSKISEGVRYSDVWYHRGDGINVVMKILRRAIILTSVRLLILGGFRTFYFSSSKIMEGVRYSDVRYNRGDGINVVMKILRRAIILTSIWHRKSEINNRSGTIIPNIRVKNLNSGRGGFWRVNFRCWRFFWFLGCFKGSHPNFAI